MPNLSPGIMIDYNASAAFDRVLGGLALITCLRVGCPFTAGLFMYQLLKVMSFHCITGLGKSFNSFSNNDDSSQTGQGILQGSSSIMPIYTLCSNVSLQAYRKVGIDASFTNPLDDKTINEHVIQYVDDKTQFVCLLGLYSLSEPHRFRTRHDIYLLQSRF